MTPCERNNDEWQLVVTKYENLIDQSIISINKSLVPITKEIIDPLHCHYRRSVRLMQRTGIKIKYQYMKTSALLAFFAREFIGNRWIPPQKTNHPEHCFLCKHGHAVGQTVVLSLIWDAMTITWRLCQIDIFIKAFWTTFCQHLTLVLTHLCK